MNIQLYDSYKIELLEIMAKKYDSDLRDTIAVSINNNLKIIRDTEENLQEISFFIRIIGHRMFDDTEEVDFDSIVEEDMEFAINLLYRLTMDGIKEMENDQLDLLAKHILYPTLRKDIGDMFIKLDIPAFLLPKEALGIK